MIKRKDTQIEFLIKADTALFTDPLNRISAEKISYPVPTYSALRGILINIYSSPEIVWYVDSCRVLNRIEYEPMPIYNPFKSQHSGDRYTYQYLSDCAYIVKAHYDFNYDDITLSDDWRYGYHSGRLEMALRSGGRKDLFMGCSECIAMMADMPEKEVTGHYDGSGRIDLGIMFHSYVMPTAIDPYRKALFSEIFMEDGIIRYKNPNECSLIRVLNKEEAFDTDRALEERRVYEPQLRIVRDRRRSDNA